MGCFDIDSSMRERDLIKNTIFVVNIVPLNIVSRCLTSPCSISIFHFILTGRDLI